MLVLNCLYNSLALVSDLMISKIVSNSSVFIVMVVSCECFDLVAGIGFDVFFMAY